MTLIDAQAYSIFLIYMCSCNDWGIYLLKKVVLVQYLLRTLLQGPLRKRLSDIFYITFVLLLDNLSCSLDGLALKKSYAA